MTGRTHDTSVDAAALLFLGNHDLGHNDLLLASAAHAEGIIIDAGLAAGLRRVGE